MLILNSMKIFSIANLTFQLMMKGHILLSPSRKWTLNVPMIMCIFMMGIHMQALFWEALVAIPHLQWLQLPKEL